MRAAGLGTGRHRHRRRAGRPTKIDEPRGQGARAIDIEVDGRRRLDFVVAVAAARSLSSVFSKGVHMDVAAKEPAHRRAPFRVATTRAAAGRAIFSKRRPIGHMATRS
jgi:hypothetical protein